MRTDVFEREAKLLDFVVKEIEFCGLINVETKNVNAVNSFIEKLESSAIDQMGMEELSKLHDESVRVNGLISALCPESKKYVGEDKIKFFRDAVIQIEKRLEVLGKKRSRREFAKTNAAELVIFGLGSLLAVIYTIFSIVRRFSGFDLTYVVPLIIGLVVAPDLKQLKKFKFIPILVVGVATILRYVLRVKAISGGMFTIFALHDLLPIILVIVISFCVIARKCENDFGDSLIICGSYVLWCTYLYLVINVAPRLVADSPWHMVWFNAVTFAAVNFITYFIEANTADGTIFTRMTTNIASFVFILVHVLFAGAYGAEIVPLLALLIAEAVLGNKIVHKCLD